MASDFDRDYWQAHWQEARVGADPLEPNPYVQAETADLRVGTALDAGCGQGGEALWLAEQGWQVTAVDISEEALAVARARAGGPGPVGGRVQWIAADLTTWEPGETFDLVLTNYAHPATGQLAFYARIAGWVAPGGTLLVVGHRHGERDEGAGHDHGHGHGHRPPEVEVTAASITALLDPGEWRIETAAEPERSLGGPHARPGWLYDVVVRAVRT